MLGWFKKKFARKKREEAETPVEAEQVTEAAPDAEGEAAVPVTTGPEAAAAGAVEGGKEALRPAPEAEASEPAAGPPPEPEPAAEVAPPEVEEELEADAITEVPEEEAPGPPAEPSPQEAGSADADAAVAAERAEPEQRTVDVGRDKPRSMFRRLQERLGKTRDSLVHRLDSLFLGKKEIDEQLLDDLEEILITADLGVGTTMELLDAARRSVRRRELSDPQALRKVLQDRILAFLQESDQPAELVMPEEGPFVIMVVGVNGVGKTTSIGKIAAKFVRSGQSVLLVAGDTFRAAAIDQLRIWGDRVGVEVVAGEQGADPSSVVFDGVARAVADNYDVVLIDTAGRLHTSVNLMEELKKIRRVIGKKLAGAPHEVMLVLDATTGQNGISQAKLFHEAVGVTGLTLTKLDGTAKGGIVVNVCRELGIPVRFIGIGEHVDDLRDFSPEEFVDALFARADGERDS
ncbi:signal recognition particle-docking protein FtsY [Thermodesulfobacteriota bacterium B35]